MRISMKAALAGGVLMIIGLGQVSGALAADKGFVVVNTNSQRAIQNVWTALAGERDDPWKPANVNEAIGPQTNSTFTISGSNCFYDVKVQYSDGYVQTFSNVNVCRMQEVTAS